jgi:hypothetical protein
MKGVTRGICCHKTTRLREITDTIFILVSPIKFHKCRSHHEEKDDDWETYYQQPRRHSPINHFLVLPSWLGISACRRSGSSPSKPPHPVLCTRICLWHVDYNGSFLVFLRHSQHPQNLLDFNIIVWTDSMMFLSINQKIMINSITEWTLALLFE